jgi:hypothetical protein
VPTHKADEYYSYLLRTGVADYRATPGNRSHPVEAGELVVHQNRSIG